MPIIGLKVLKITFEFRYCFQYRFLNSIPKNQNVSAYRKTEVIRYTEITIWYGIPVIRFLRYTIFNDFYGTPFNKII